MFPIVSSSIRTNLPGVYVVFDESSFGCRDLNDWLAYGWIKLKLRGILNLSATAWEFTGVLSADHDAYNFNPSTHRSLVAEWLTELGSKLPGNQYTILFEDEVGLHKNGGRSASGRFDEYNRASWFFQQFAQP